jgi:YHS domain-containing protein
MADDAGTYRTAKIKEHLMSPARRCLAFFLLALLTAVPAHAQNTAEPAVALQGMDVVSYFKDGGPVKGQSAHRADFDGARYLFSSAQNRAAFVADPDRYLPQFSGLCATGVSVGKQLKGDANSWKVVDGKLYLYYSDAVRAKGDDDPTTLARAHKNWAARK